MPEPVRLPGAQVRVFIGTLAGATSPVRTWTPPLVGAEITLEAGARLVLDVPPGHEHGVLPHGAEVLVDGSPVPADNLRHLPPGAASVELAAGATPVRLLLIGGEPLGEEIVMWWNFIGRSHEEVVAHRWAWQREIGLAEDAHDDDSDGDGSDGDDNDGDDNDGGSGAPRFGTFPPGTPAPLPAPVLPAVRLVGRR